MTSETTTATKGFPLVIPTKSQAPTARLVLRNDLGQVIQQWLIRQNKCTLGSSTSCNIRCELPGIAAYHALLVVGARQTFVRALAPKITRDGKPVTEILLTDQNSHFEVAGHRFELARGAQKVEPADDGEQSNRMKFTLARPFELQSRPQTSTVAESPILPPHDPTNIDTKWIAQLVQAAIEPLECQIHNVLEPLEALQSESRQQRELQKKLLSDQREQEQRAWEHKEVPAEQIEEFAARQSAAMDAIGERISDVTQQLTTIERIIARDQEQAAEESDKHRAAYDQVETQSTAIEQLQSGMVSVSSAIQDLEQRQQAAREEDQQWKSEIQDQTSALRESFDSLSNQVNTTALTAVTSEEIVAWKSEMQTQLRRLQDAVDSLRSDASEGEVDKQIDAEWKSEVQTQFSLLRESVADLKSQDPAPAESGEQDAWRDGVQSQLSQLSETVAQLVDRLPESTDADSQESTAWQVEVQDQFNALRSCVESLASRSEEPSPTPTPSEEDLAWKVDIQNRFSQLNESVEALAQRTELSAIPATPAVEDIAWRADIQNQFALLRDVVAKAVEPKAEPQASETSSETFGVADNLGADNLGAESQAGILDRDQHGMPETNTIDESTVDESSIDHGSPVDHEIDQSQADEQASFEATSETTSFETGGEEANSRADATESDQPTSYDDQDYEEPEFNDPEFNVPFDVVSRNQDFDEFTLDPTLNQGARTAERFELDIAEQVNEVEAESGQTESASDGESEIAAAAESSQDFELPASEVPDSEAQIDADAAIATEPPAAAEAIDPNSVDQFLPPTEVPAIQSSASPESSVEEDADAAWLWDDSGDEQSPANETAVEGDDEFATGGTIDNFTSSLAETSAEDSDTSQAQPAEEEELPPAMEAESQPVDPFENPSNAEPAEAQMESEFETLGQVQDPYSNATPELEGLTPEAVEDPVEVASDNEAQPPAILEPLSADQPVPVQENEEAGQPDELNAFAEPDPGESPDTAPPAESMLVDGMPAETSVASDEEDANRSLPSWWLDDDHAQDGEVFDEFEEAAPLPEETIDDAGEFDEFAATYDEPLVEPNEFPEPLAGLDAISENASPENASPEAIPFAGEENLDEQVQEAPDSISMSAERDFSSAINATPVDDIEAPAETQDADEPEDEFFGMDQYAPAEAVEEELAPEASDLLNAAPLVEPPPMEPEEEPAPASTWGSASKTTPENAEGDAAEEEEDSVEDYMRKLLARMRGVPEDEVAAEEPVKSAPPAPVSAPAPNQVMQSAPQSEARVPDTMEGSSLASDASAPPTSAAPQSTQGAQLEDAVQAEEPEQYMPRVLAPERIQNLAAMRELANSTARTAIHKSTRQRHFASLILKLAIALIGVVVGGVLIAINGFNVNIGLVATIAAFLVSAIWGYDAMVTLKPLLQSRLVLQPNQDTDDEEDSAEAVPAATDATGEI